MSAPRLIGPQFALPSDVDEGPRPVLFLFPHATGSPEQYRQAARRYVIDFVAWFDEFMAGAPQGAAALPYRVLQGERYRVRGLFGHILRELDRIPLEECPEALAQAAGAAQEVLGRVAGARRPRAARGRRP